ncbi:hypothetical protein GDO81_012590 [Engystomops pustulosus]|uniref:Uncharacterized protein n=1 Tax=Engystomops pustulosus TaxID=76066 RepID=A0AAV7AUB4_ENGPU|nr:hypothetical protein GDO81_012590 [Engystomops pustulosus]
MSHRDMEIARIFLASLIVRAAALERFTAQLVVKGKASFWKSPNESALMEAVKSCRNLIFGKTKITVLFAERYFLINRGWNVKVLV